MKKLMLILVLNLVPLFILLLTLMPVHCSVSMADWINWLHHTPQVSLHTLCYSPQPNNSNVNEH
ncbi:hypothetical protein [Photobacterium salinisoli]|uniref:hypothetical protein n=1 Tax=Photobacterium salinisoli TaxID=1616783 RepID=UPI000EA0322B|nr:hypothetical protein [Photobacterium salinisoli]